jgi:Integrase core domain
MKKPPCSSAPLAEQLSERLIGSIRREWLDNVIVFSEAHLRRVLRTYPAYYNEMRTHRPLDKDAPVHRPTQRKKGEG